MTASRSSRRFQPCLQTEGVDLPIDTTGLADGSHDLQVVVTDAAGNSATVLDQTITTANLTTVSSLLPTPPPASTASPVYAFALDQTTAALGASTTRTYGNSSLTMSGTLDDEAGVAAPGVSVTAWAKPTDGSAFSELAQTTTDGAGRWTLRLPKGSSRVVNIVAGTGATPASSASTVSLTETVTPTLSLSISTPGRAQLVFSGEIGISPLGTPRPLVFIEVQRPTRMADRRLPRARRTRTGATATSTRARHSPSGDGSSFAPSPRQRRSGP